MNKASSHLFIVLTILFGLYGQVVLKWQSNAIGTLPIDWPGRSEYVLKMLTNPWVITSLLSAFLGMLTWMLALAKTDLSYAYPFTSLSFVLVLGASAVFFHEPITANKLIGMGFIILGIVIGSR